MYDFNVKEYVESFSDEELCAEVLSWQISKDATEEEILSLVKKNKISSFFANGHSVDKINFIKSVINENSKSPCLITADVERGPALYPEMQRYSVSMMNLCAACDETLAFEIGKYTARLSRSLGIHLALSPVVDINFNPNNPVTNTRSAGDTTESVLSAAFGYGRGMRSEGNLAIAPKHFPGDGVDDKNQHFCTTVNSLSKEEWMASYGKIYQQIIDEDIEAIMVAHIALPWYDPARDECGYMPATLSEPLMTGLLKKELGFNGCIISDAMSMIGTAARVPVERLSVEFLRAGGDLVLFPEKDDHERILEALHAGYLKRTRLVDAAERVVTLKYKLGLFENKEYTLAKNDISKTKELLTEAAKKSITLVRDVENILPLTIENGATILVISLTPQPKDFEGDEFPVLANELEKRGYQVIRMTNPSHYRVDEIIDSVDAVFVSSYIDTINCSGSSLRLGFNNLMAFWRGYIFKCKKLIFLSFGDPYKLLELSFLKTYVNAYIKSDIAIKAAVAACLGETEMSGVSPISLSNIRGCSK